MSFTFEAVFGIPAGLRQSTADAEDDVGDGMAMVMANTLQR